jgi:hypothetical protein
MVQVPLGYNVPPVNVREVSSAAGENVGEPQPLVQAEGVLATTICVAGVVVLGKGSVN